VNKGKGISTHHQQHCMELTRLVLAIQEELNANTEVVLMNRWWVLINK
jgi:hypothetical protein